MKNTVYQEKNLVVLQKAKTIETNKDLYDVFDDAIEFLEVKKKRKMK